MLLTVENKELGMRTIEVTSTDVDKATAKGLSMLDATIDQVYVKVLAEGSMLTKAKIEMTLFDNDEEKQEFIKQHDTKKVSVQINTEASPKSKELPYSKEDNEQALKIAREFIEGFMGSYGVEAHIDAFERDQDPILSITGDKMGNLIGFHGAGLDAIQTITNAIVREAMPAYKRRVYIDIEHYRSRREDTLVSMAKRMAEKALQYKRSIKLEPMNAYERRIIHNALSGIDHIGTHSVGDEPNRYLVIDYVD